MKKSDIIYEAACKISDGGEFICLTLGDDIYTDSPAGWIRRDIQEDVNLLAKVYSRRKTNNFFSTSPADWKISEAEFQNIRAMYCLFLHEDYLAQGD